jgi:hypothetical protein
MCRSSVKLRSDESPAERVEVEAAALQYVRKVTGFRRPSRRNQQAFDEAVAEIADATERVLSRLVVAGRS